MRIVNIFLGIPVGLGCLVAGLAYGQSEISLKNQALSIKWLETSAGYKLSGITLTPHGDTLSIANPEGAYVSLFSEKKPGTTIDSSLFDTAQGHVFDEYKYIRSRWESNFRPLALNTAGEVVSFYPTMARSGQNEVEFLHHTDKFTARITWALDRVYTNDVLVEMEVKANKAGYYSFATPTLFPTEPTELDWAMLPGYFQGREIQPDLLRAYAYGQGVPALPVVVRERTASTLSPIIQNKQGITLAVIAEPGTATDPWSGSRDSRGEWRLGLSLMNRKGQLSPTLYHPVLGEIDSYLEAGEMRTFRFRYSLKQDDWFDVYKHAVYDIYDFKKAVELKNTNESLTNRVLSMLTYLKDDRTSLWNTHDYQGLTIGAQSYLGGVVGADKDAMKNADYGAMWMLAKITGDKVLNQTRLEPAKSFKLAQQQISDGFFKGAAVGQYYLWKSKHFTEEWGNYVEPIALTYYTMLDIGNILLFEPDDQELKERLRFGAERLLEWQHPDGRWEVAYERDTEAPTFSDQLDLRPTFYGLLVAYRMLGDERYLQGAKKGADWFVSEAVKKGHFLGVCGDVRFVPDFATAQSAQALLDLYDITSDESYRTAAIEVAKIYTSSIYTHPTPSQQLKEVNGKRKADWEISQVGLSFEHGGTLGSANGGGPILLASHAGLFIRMAELTGDHLFLDMARAAAWGRDAFVDPATHVASYYWNRMDDGPGPFPHHAWWQVGWITDYLMAEISVRSGGRIQFPRGFITPKVGPHQPYGFAAGEIFSDHAALWLPEDWVEVSNQQIDFMAAKSQQGTDVYLILLNNSVEEQTSLVRFLKDDFSPEISILNEQGTIAAPINLKDHAVTLTMAPLSLRVLKLSRTVGRH